MLTAEGCCPSTTVAGLQDNTLADGLFHVATLIALGVALVMLVGEWRRRLRAPAWGRLAGLALVGWGLFNVIEGIIDHHILTLHHVRDDVGDPTGWDLAFLGFGLALLIAGFAIARRAQRGDRFSPPSARS
jgi:uncharacterized membrane protein